MVLSSLKVRGGMDYKWNDLGVLFPYFDFLECVSGYK